MTITGLNPELGPYLCESCGQRSATLVASGFEDKEIFMICQSCG